MCAENGMAGRNRFMKRRGAQFIIIALCSSPLVAAEDSVSLPLSLDAYIRVALEHNPQVRVADAAVRSSEASQRSAVARLLPHFDAQAQAGASGGTSTTNQSAAANATSSSYSLGLSGQQLLYDFGKTTRSVKASARTVSAAVQDDRGSVQTVILGARTAYYNYLLSQMQYAVAQEALGQAQAHLDEAKILFQTGKQAQYTVTEAEVNFANASVTLITTKNGVKLAKVQMDVAAGVTLKEPVVCSDSLDKEEPDITKDQAIAQAMDSLPLLRAARARLEAAKLQLASTKSALLPDLNASGSVGLRRSDVVDWQNNWSVGVSLSASLYEGGALVAAVDQSRAAVDQNSAQLDASLQSVRSDVEQHYYEKMDAAERIAATQKLIVQAQDGLRLSQERFAAGAAASLEVTDAEIAVANAKSSHAQALFDYRTAHAKLLASIGAL
jgi:outer membrane protein